MVLTKNMKPSTGFMYFISQCAGGTLGGGLLRLAVGKTNYKSGIGLNPTLTAGGGLICEFMGTFLLIFTVFFVAVEHSKRKSKPGVGLDGSDIIGTLAPLPIGFAVVVAHVVIGPLTGCGINPARVIGAVVWSDDPFPSYHWIYWVGPFLASAIAPSIYYFMHGATLKDDEENVDDQEDCVAAKSDRHDLEAPFPGESGTVNSRGSKARD
jgi:glycerol uptake facilitator-like aquaporin